MSASSFNPSRKKDGSALKVGINWLWSPKDHWSFDIGGRAGDFIEYKDDPTFTAAFLAMSKSALDLSVDLRRHLVTAANALALMERDQAADSGWMKFHMGIAAGLDRKVDEAKALFSAAIVADPKIDWVQKRNSSIHDLLGVIHDHDGFCDLIEQKIRQARELLKLPVRLGSMLPA